jgi:hypothetical protein
MFSFFKKNKINKEVPEWASFFNNDQYNTFLNAIEDYFYSKNVIYTLGDGMIEAGPNDFGFDKMGLVNVAQVCKLDDPRDFKEIVKEHFEALARTYQFDEEFKKIVDDYEKVRKFLGVRLYPADYAESIGKDLTIGRDFAGDIYAMLVFDLPDSVMSIKPEQAKKWGKSIEELFKTGIQNIRQKYPLDISQQQFGDFYIWFAQGDHFFTPNIVFNFDDLQKMAGAKGSLIGIPHRHAVLIYPIENIRVVEVITGFIQTVSGMYEEGPGSVSNNVFWYKDGLFTNLPYKVEDNKIQFYPPEEFVEILNTLQAEE